MDPILHQLLLDSDLDRAALAIRYLDALGKTQEHVREIRDINIQRLQEDVSDINLTASLLEISPSRYMRLVREAEERAEAS